MKKEFDILKKPYLPPRVEFEEIEDNEVGLLRPSYTEVTVINPEHGDGDDDPDALSVDFVMNDVELNWEQ